VALRLLRHGFMRGARVVIGVAGLAGLSAAHELARAGAAVTLLDARDYAGGRVRTIRDSSAGQHAEAVESGQRAARELLDDLR
jgi:monoamine oxidase